MSFFVLSVQVSQKKVFKYFKNSKNSKKSDADLMSQKLRNKGRKLYLNITKSYISSVLKIINALKAHKKQAEI